MSLLYREEVRIINHCSFTLFPHITQGVQCSTLLVVVTVLCILSMWCYPLYIKIITIAIVTVTVAVAVAVPVSVTSLTLSS